MKALFIGGIKSGKSRLAEAYILEKADAKPYYLATTEFIDEEMRTRIAAHHLRRQDRFITVEEPLQLVQALQGCSGNVLIECMSMWINNMLYHGMSIERVMAELNAVIALPLDMVFVQNEVGLGVIPDNPLARRFVDLSGQAAQMLAEHCDHVFFCCAGLKFQLK